MKGKRKTMLVTLSFFGEVSDYSLTNYRTRRFSTVYSFPDISFRYLKVRFHRELCSVEPGLNAYPFITPPFCDNIYSILLLQQEYRVVAFMLYVFIQQLVLNHQDRIQKILRQIPSMTQ